ncbi:MAG: nitrile hydratase subunit beta [Nitriliruptorales bacterium]|nr:nitrile hydratase subunit beta [Nitriliruptorales bacterium]
MMDRRPHDRGGVPDRRPIDWSDGERPDWGVLALCLRAALSARGILRLDEIRRATEDLDDYRSLGYFERRVLALENVLVEKGVITHEEIDARAVLGDG